MGEIIKEGKLYDVEFHCDVCGCEFKESVDFCDNRIFKERHEISHSCQCPTCHTWVYKTKQL